MSRPSALVDEDAVEYRIYACDGHQLPDMQELENVALSLCTGYIWFDQSLRLKERQLPVRHYYGKTHFGQCLDDEELIVYLLLQLSRRYEQLLVKVQDHDGEVLLIWASDVLPAWLNPETAPNRVFIHGGQLIIVPRKKDVGPSAADWPLTIDSVVQAIKLVSRHAALCRAPEAVNKTIDALFSKYPVKMVQNSHYCRCMLPAKLGRLLSVCPQAVAPAVRAFHNRDAISMSSLKEQFVGAAEGAQPQTLVCCRVQFTKLLYAMISLDQFKPPSPLSRWTLAEAADHPLFKAHNIGLRLTYGFELLLMQHGRGPAAGCEWNKFLGNLKNNGYFADHCVGSAGYEQLLMQATTYYESSFDLDEADRIRSILDSLNDDDQAWQPVDAAADDDDDSWLIVTEKDLSTVVGSDDWKTSRAAVKTGVSKFIMDQCSSFDGVTTGSTAHSGGGGFNFSGEQFKKSLRRVLDLPPADDEAAEEEDSECSFDDYDDSDEADQLEELETVTKWSSDMQNYMAQMDRELAQTSIGRSFDRSQTSGPKDIDLEDDDDFKPVNVDKNLVNNLLQSYWSEGGQTGPAASVLHSLKLNPPRPQQLHDSDDDDDDENIEETILRAMS